MTKKTTAKTDAQLAAARENRRKKKEREKSPDGMTDSERALSLADAVVAAGPANKASSQARAKRMHVQNLHEARRLLRTLATLGGLNNAAGDEYRTMADSVAWAIDQIQPK